MEFNRSIELKSDYAEAYVYRAQVYPGDTRIFFISGAYNSIEQTRGKGSCVYYFWKATSLRGWFAEGFRMHGKMLLYCALTEKNIPATISSYSPELIAKLGWKQEHVRMKRNCFLHK